MSLDCGCEATQVTCAAATVNDGTEQRVWADGNQGGGAA